MDWQPLIFSDVYEVTHFTNLKRQKFILVNIKGFSEFLYSKIPIVGELKRYIFMGKIYHKVKITEANMRGV